MSKSPSTFPPIAASLADIFPLTTDPLAVLTAPLDWILPKTFP